jgi:FkbM family methyltransferase
MIGEKLPAGLLEQLPDGLINRIRLHQEIKELGISQFVEQDGYNSISIGSNRTLVIHSISLSKYAIANNYYRRFFYLASLVVLHYKYAVGLAVLSPPYPASQRKHFGRFLKCNIEDILAENLTDARKRSELGEFFKDRFSLRKNSLFIDCGCWLGFGSIRAGDFLKEGKIIAFEADPDVFRVLEKNIQLNKLCNIEVYNAAVYEKTGNIDFLTQFDLMSQKSGGGISAAFVADGHGRADYAIKTKSYKTVKCYAIDDVVVNDETCNFPHIICSITVNGGELNALKGMKRILKLNIPLAIHTICLDNNVYIEMKAYLEEAGFCVFRGSNKRVIAAK